MLRRVKTQVKHTKKICAGCREGAVTDRTHQRWLAEFPAGGFSPDGAPWLVRPVEINSHQIETLTENNQCSTRQEGTGVLKIPKSIK